MALIVDFINMREYEKKLLKSLLLLVFVLLLNLFILHVLQYEKEYFESHPNI